MRKTKLGNSDIDVSVIGLGCMGMSEFYGESDDRESVNVLHRAFELGLNFLDTADQYGAGRNEELISEAVKGKRAQTVIATKFGIVRTGGYEREINGRPEYVVEACEKSLKRLGTDYIDLYYAHRIDEKTPIEDTVGAMARLVEEGKVRAIGLSEPSPDTLRRAHAVHPISAIQTEYSMATREPAEAVLPVCRDIGATFVAYSPICRGLFGDRKAFFNPDDQKEIRHFLPRFQGENLEKNMRLAGELESFAAEKKCTLAQLSLAWLMAGRDQVVPIPGTRRIKYLEENIRAAEVDLGEDDYERINEILARNPVFGDRYTAEGMKGVNV